MRHRIDLEPVSDDLLRILRSGATDSPALVQKIRKSMDDTVVLSDSEVEALVNAVARWHVVEEDMTDLWIDLQSTTEGQPTTREIITDRWMDVYDQ